jgi:SOS-response transcriptional repressor LexA
MTEASAVQPKRCAACGHVLGAVQRPLTRVQADLLRFLGVAIARDGCAPSYREIAEAFGWRSLATVAEHLANLEEKGFIRREHNTERGITLLVPFDEIGTVPMERRHG